MTGINDVAAATGVSTATVSRSLRGLPGVSATTRERVLEAAARLGYVPSPQAAGLASGSTRTIAIVVPYLTRWFFAEVVEAAERVLRAAGYDVLLYSLGGDPAVRHRVLEQHVLGKRVDAVGDRGDGADPGGGGGAGAARQAGGHARDQHRALALDPDRRPRGDPHRRAPPARAGPPRHRLRRRSARRRARLRHPAGSAAGYRDALARSGWYAAPTGSSRATSRRRAGRRPARC